MLPRARPAHPRSSPKCHRASGYRLKMNFIELCFCIQLRRSDLLLAVGAAHRIDVLRFSCAIGTLDQGGECVGAHQVCGNETMYLLFMFCSLFAR